MRKIVGFIAAIVVFQSSCTLAQSIKNTSAAIKPFSAEYSLLHKSDPVGTGTRQLERLDDGSYKYSYDTSIKWLIFSDKREETSWLTIENDIVTPSHYRYERSGTGRDKSYEWRYDAGKNSANNVKDKQNIRVDFTQHVQDKLSYHLQHRIKMLENPEQKQFIYSIIGTNGKISSHVYQYDGEEELMLPYGNIKTIRFKREIVEKERTTYAWFAPDLDYLLVKLYQVKAGIEQFEAQLISVKFGQDTPVKKLD